MFERTTETQQLAKEMIRLQREKEFRTTLNEINAEVSAHGVETDRRSMYVIERWAARSLQNGTTTVETWLKQVIEGPIPTDLQVFREAQATQIIKKVCERCLLAKQHALAATVYEVNPAKRAHLKRTQ